MTTVLTEHLSNKFEEDAHWLYMHRRRDVRPCFHLPMLADFNGLLAEREAHPTTGLSHLVVASSAPVFNLGGDLEHFSAMIRNNDREGLLDYGRLCVEGVHHLHHHMGGTARSIALVQGDALGGGMELALSCQIIVAEEGVKMGLPEIMFGLFPGMGAFSFLCQRVSPHLAEKIILGGQIYSAEELLIMGVIDKVVPKGQGEAAVRDIIRQEKRTPYSHMALGHIRRHLTHVPLEELNQVVELWVDNALKLSDRSLKVMERLVRAQYKMIEAAYATLDAEAERDPFIDRVEVHTTGLSIA